MKAFDLDLYNRLVAEGKTPKIVTRDGRSARIICTDKKGDYPVVAVILKSENVEDVRTHMDDGKYLEGDEGPSDLFFADIEPTYRPYKDKDEVMKDHAKHCGWLKEKATGDYYFIYTIRKHSDGRVVVGTEFSDIDLEKLLQKYTWLMNDDPCGVKEEEV